MKKKINKYNDSIKEAIYSNLTKTIQVLGSPCATRAALVPQGLAPQGLWGCTALYGTWKLIADPWVQ